MALVWYTENPGFHPPLYNPLKISHRQLVEPLPVIQSPLDKGGGSVNSGKICAGAQASAGGEGFVLDHPYT